MADVATTKAQIGAVLKIVYGKKVEEQANRATFILNQFEASQTRFGGKHWEEPMHDEGGQAVGSYNDNEAVSDASSESTKEIQITVRQHYGLVQITGLAMAVSKNNLWAFVQAKDFEIQNKLKWLLAQLNAQFYQRGDGQMGVVDSIAGAVITLRTTAAAAVPTNVNWFRKDGHIDVYSDTTWATKRNGTQGTKKQGWIITATSRAAKTVTIAQGNSPNAAGTGVVAGDRIVYEDAQNPAPTNFGKQLLGLTTLVDDTTEGPTTVQNIDRSVYPIFKSTVTHNSAVFRDLSLDWLQQHEDSVAQDCGEEPDFWIAGYGMKRQLLNLLWHDIRFAPEQLKAGYKVLQFNGHDWLTDKDAPYSRIFAGVKQYLQKYVVEPIGILDQAGAQMERVSKTDLYELMIGGYLNIGLTRPNAWGKMKDVREP